MEGRPIWIWSAAGVLLLLIVLNFARLTPPGTFARSSGPASGGQSGPSAQASQAPPGTIAISIANSIGKQEWMHRAVQSFNDASARDGALQLEGRPVFVDILQESVEGRRQDYRSGPMVADTVSERIKPTILSPADEASILKLQKDWQAIKGGTLTREVGQPLAHTPMVIATWQSRAQVLGCWPEPEPECTWQRFRSLAIAPDGWGSLGRAEWGRLKLGYGYVGESAAGTSAAILMCLVGAEKSTALTVADVEAPRGCGQFMADLEQVKIHSGSDTVWLVDQMAQGGPEYLDAAILFEVQVVLANQNRGRELREPLVAIYPRDGTLLVGHPFTILEGAPWVTPDQIAAARIFQRYLLSVEQQQALLATGLRPVTPGVQLGSPIERSYGANPQADLILRDSPESLVVDGIVEVWHRIKKHAVVAIVFDKSGSMAGAKMSAAVAGATEFVRRMDRDDRLIWRPFDTGVHPPVEGMGSDISEELISRIRSTPASGQTALYDAVLSTYAQLGELRRTYGDTRRYGMVVLSDGQDTHSSIGLSVLESRLKPLEADPNGIQIHTIAIGTDADEQVLRKIASAAHGRYWKGQTANEIVAVYKAIATYY
jgi:Ca-activated chloride channel homolog